MVSERKTDLAAFLDGYKPALLMDIDSRHLHLLEAYPSCQHDELNLLFFRNEEMKQQFLMQMDQLKGNSFEACRLTGTTIGYPPRSVEFFACNCEIEEQTGELPNREYELGMIWAGFRFSAHIDMVKGEAQWLWDTYKHPKAVGNPLYLWTSRSGYIEVPYGDFEQLETARQYIMQQRGLVPAV